MFPVIPITNNNPGLTTTLLAAILLLSATTAFAVQPPEHLETDCNSCHDHHQNPPPSPDALCLDCHAEPLPEADRIAGVFHDPEDRACSRCHGYHATEMLKATNQVFERPFQDEQVLVQCGNCHRENTVVQNVSEGHYAAADLYHVNAVDLMDNSPSDGCLQCHDQDSGYAMTPGSTPTFPVHGSHPIGVSIPFSSPWEASSFQPIIHESLELIDQQLECRTCHWLPAETVFRLVPFESVTAMCNGCHDMAPGMSPVPDTKHNKDLVASR